MDAHNNRREYERVEVCGGELLEFIRKNKALSVEFCRQLYQELYAPIEAKIEHETETYTFKQLEADFTKLNQDYLRRAIGPEKWNVLSEMDKKTEEAQKNNFKKLKGYQEKVMKERQRTKEAEIEARQRSEELMKLHQEAIREKEKNAENLRSMEQNFQNQINKLREEEWARRQEEMTKLQNLQISNFHEYQDMVKEFNERQCRLIETMIEHLRIESENNQQATSKFLETISAMPPPTGTVKEDGCKFM